jgi:DNA-binding PadR family transcriptional regulator
VGSWWEESYGSPPKRTYRMTDRGLDHLGEGAEALRQGLQHISGFLDRFGAAEDPHRGVAA